MKYTVKIDGTWLAQLVGNEFVTKYGERFIIGGVRELPEYKDYYELFFVPVTPRINFIPPERIH